MAGEIGILRRGHPQVRQLRMRMRDGDRAGWNLAAIDRLPRSSWFRPENGVEIVARIADEERCRLVVRRQPFDSLQQFGEGGEALGIDVRR